VRDEGGAELFQEVEELKRIIASFMMSAKLKR
jgi:hypothetical protein